MMGLYQMWLPISDDPGRGVSHPENRSLKHVTKIPNGQSQECWSNFSRLQFD